MTRRQIAAAVDRAGIAHSRSRARLKADRDTLAEVLAEVLARFGDVGPGHHTAAATTEELDRWRAALPEQPDV